MCSMCNAWQCLHKQACGCLPCVDMLSVEDTIHSLKKTLSKHCKHVPAYFSSLRACNCRQTPFESNDESDEKKDTQLE